MISFAQLCDFAPWRETPFSALYLLLAVLICSNLSAEDRVVLRTTSGSRIGVPCVILDYTGREVSYFARPGTATKRALRRDVVEVTTQYSPPHIEARELLAKGEAKEAFQKLETALEQENRVWVRREILATQVKCALWHGDRVTAGERFLTIVESDPDTLYFPQMPLAWNEAPPSAEVIRAAKLWIAQKPNSAAMLLGASHLLTDPPSSRLALHSLRELAKDERSEIQRYSQMQLWRSNVLKDDVSKDELLRWERAMEDARETIGGGPRFILGLGWHHRHDHLAAAAAWLWLPLVSPEDRWLTAEAAFRAAQSLAAAGQRAESQALFTEVTTRFGDTPFGPKAEAAKQQPAK